MKLVASFLLLAGAVQAQPVLDAWIRTPGSNAAVRRIAPEVHEVLSDADYVYVESAGLTLHSLAPWGAGGATAAGPQLFHFRFPRHPLPARRMVAAPQGIIGAFLTGVPVYSSAAGSSWQGANIWHPDTLSRVPARPDLFTRHGGKPQLIGFALDGYPIYAGAGERSGYRLRHITVRRTLPDGTALTPGQEGPAVSNEYPLGTFVEDYEFTPGAGTLDRHNGRDTEAGYGYYATADYPYLAGPEFYGAIDAPATCDNMQLSSVQARAGTAVDLSLCTSSSHLERVHEKLIHLIVVSKDLKDFAHLHPEQQSTAQSWKVTHTFPRAGLYRLYAEYTAAGEKPRVARFTVEVAPGGSLQTLAEEAPQGTSMKHAQLRAGEDVPFEFESNQPLEPYLGAWGHFVVIGEDGSEFLHAHPAEEMPIQDPWQHSHATGPGPQRVNATIGFPRAGRYRLWAQFQIAGVVTTTAWNLEVALPVATVPSHVDTRNTVSIQVTRSGYEPSRIPLEKGKPTRLAFTRADAANCGGTVVFPDLGIRAELPAGRTTIVELPATEREELRFACGMGMLKGVLLALP